MMNFDKEIDCIKNSAYHILIVEDTVFVNNAINTTLSEFNYNCDQAYTLEEAKTFISQKNYDFILLDLTLPDGAGAELVTKIHKISHAKIIILTATTDIVLREKLYKLGILDYIVKDKYFSDFVTEIDTTIKLLALNKTADILLIDDSKLLQIHVTKILEVRNYNVISAYTAQEAYEKLLESNINMIILDMELPDANGLDVLRKIKKNPVLSKIPVIILSGSHNPETVRNALKSGAIDYIQKPFNIEELVLKVDTAIHVNRQDIQIRSEQKLLSEYKDAVDRSSIVSKMDPNGIITFVNDKFTEISGYSAEELLGKTHDIVRHPDTSDLDFENMWKTIKDKKPWSGKIKNMKKGGGHYWVNTVINPIVDYKGKILEYIAIRTDITELEDIREELESDLNISNKNFSEAYNISHEYERAISESNILSRANLEGIITYVNDHFCRISGYTREELVGNLHSIVKHPDNPKSIYNDLWDTISSGRPWHGQLRNKCKDGSTYYLDNTIVPIFDESENITEYLGISHDVTEMVNFHEEIESTQKEVIYKMGEIGETRSKETGYHVKRVAEYSRLLAILLGLGKSTADLLCSASPMHDIGKVGIPDSILKKPGKLDAEEWIIMMTHAEIGYNILKSSKRPILKAAATVAYRHHEKWDGSGYPNGLSGEDIHIYGRITAIADVFDALGSNRCYKSAWDLAQILDLFKEERGKHFDPKLVDLFFEHLDKFLLIKEKYKED